MSKSHNDMVRISAEALHAIAHRLCDQPLFGLVHRAAEAARVDPPSKVLDQTGWDTILFLLGSNLKIVHGNIRRSDFFSHDCASCLENIGFFLNQMRNGPLTEVYHVARVLQLHQSWDLVFVRLLLSIHPDEYLIDSWLASPGPPREEEDDKAQWI